MTPEEINAQQIKAREAANAGLCSSGPAGSTNPIDRGDSFGLDEVIEWAAWVDHTEGTEVSSSDKAICIAHAILEASCAYESNIHSVTVDLSRGT